MADVPGKFFSATKVRTGVSPSSPGSLVGEPLPPVNPPGTSLNSVGLTMPSAFTVSNSPLTSNGTIGVTGAGTVGQYIRGDGSLADFPESSGGGSSVSYYLNGSVNQGTIGGVAYKELNKVPILGAGTDFTINANGYIASFITDAGDPNLLEIPAGNWNFETFFSASSGGGSPTFYVELYKVNSGGTATLIASNSTFPELIAFGTNVISYFSTLAVPTTALALTDRLAIRYYVTHSGRTITLHTEDNHLCQIITTFTTGLTALNGLTAQIQNFAVGTSGTDFAIASATATHTFNLPTASATNRGALSSADWALFTQAYNDKINSASVTGTTTKTLTLVQQDGGEIQASWSDLNTDAVTSVFGRTGAVIAVSGDYTTAQVTESGNLYFTNARAIASVLTGYTSGAGTISAADTILSAIQKLNGNIGGLTTGVSSVFGRTGAVVAANGDYYLGTTAIQAASANQAITGITGITFVAHVNDAASITTTISSTSTFFDFNLADDNLNDEWRWRFTPSGASVYDAMRLVPTTNTTSDLIVSGAISGSNLSGTNTGNVTLGTANGLSLSTQQLSLGLASAGVTGALSGTDWTTFNSKQNALTNPVTGTGTSGQVAFFNGTTTITGESNLFWDAANDRLGIGTNIPDNKLHILGTGSNTQTIIIQSTSSTANSYIVQQSASKSYITGLSTDTANSWILFDATASQLRFSVTSVGRGLFGTNIPSAGASGFQSNSFQVKDEIVSIGTFAGLFWENRSGGVTASSNWYGWYTTGGVIYLYNGSTDILEINGSTGAALFDSSITATSIIRSGGTSSQFLKADGSVDSSTYVQTSRTITINGTTQDLSADRTYNVGTVTSITATAGTGISISGSPITSSGTLTITNTAPDQVVSLTASTGISISGTYPNFTITNTSPASASGITGSGTSGKIAIFTGTNTIGNSKIDASGSVIYNENPTAGQFAWQFNGSTTTGQSYGANVVAGTNTSDIGFKVMNAAATVNYFVVRGDGNVGIGIASPATKLTVYSASAAISGTNDGIRLQVASYNDGARNTIAWHQDGSDLNLGRFGIAWNSSTGQMNFVWRDVYDNAAGTTELMRLTGGGNLLIGTTTSTTDTLRVNGTSFSNTIMTWNPENDNRSGITWRLGGVSNASITPNRRLRVNVGGVEYYIGAVEV